MSDDETIGPERAAAIRLRARLAVVERAAWFGFVQAMRADREGTRGFIASERARCAEGFSGSNWAKDLTPAERKMLGAEVDSGLAQLVVDAEAELEGGSD